MKNTIFLPLRWIDAALVNRSSPTTLARLATLRRMFTLVTFSMSIGLSGCATALHAIVSPALGSAVESAGESMAYDQMTPESQGISPDIYRDYNCTALALYKKAAEDSIAKPGQSRLFVKMQGFHIDAYAQVQREKACPMGRAAGAAEVGAK